MALEREERFYPTYQSARAVLNGEPQAPVELIGWTLLRSILIMPGFALVGARGKTLVFGSIAASATISLFALLRMYAATPSSLRGVSYRRRLRSRTRLKKLRA